MRASACRAVEPEGSLADAERLRKSTRGSCSCNRRPPAFLDQGSEMAVEQYQCCKAGWQGKRSGVAGEILFKILLKAKPKVYLKQT